jgi:hypothetical protein
VRKINKHVGFLRTHVIDMADTAKLPFAGADDGHRGDEDEDEDAGLDISEEEKEDECGSEENDIDGFRDISAEVMSVSKNDENFLEGSRRTLSLGSAVLEQSSREELAPIKEAESVAPTHMIATELPDCCDAVEAGHGKQSLSEQRIDEVVGSYNLSDLKKFRVELIKYVSMLEFLFVEFYYVRYKDLITLCSIFTR